MSHYMLTAFEKNGDKLLDESFEAANDLEAKRIGKRLLAEKNLLYRTHRCTSPAGKLLLFER